MDSARVRAKRSPRKPLMIKIPLECSGPERRTSRSTLITPARPAKTDAVMRADFPKAWSPIWYTARPLTTPIRAPVVSIRIMSSRYCSAIFSWKRPRW